VKQWQNISDAWMTGAEGTVVFSFVKNLMLLHTSRYLYGWRENFTPLPQVAPYKSFTSVRYSRKLWNLQLENEWAAAQTHIDPEMGEDATDSFILFHLRGQIQLPVNRKSLALTLAIENLLNNYYHEHLDWGNIPRPGRNVTLGVNVTF
jgi:iron complex outermembrane recepter protein